MFHIFLAPAYIHYLFICMPTSPLLGSNLSSFMRKRRKSICYHEEQWPCQCNVTWGKNFTARFMCLYVYFLARKIAIWIYKYVCTIMDQKCMWCIASFRNNNSIRFLFCEHRGLKSKLSCYCCCSCCYCSFCCCVNMTLSLSNYWNHEQLKESIYFILEKPGKRADSADLIGQKGRRSEMGYGQVSVFNRLVFLADPVDLRNFKWRAKWAKPRANLGAKKY